MVTTVLSIPFPKAIDCLHSKHLIYVYPLAMLDKNGQCFQQEDIVQNSLLVCIKLQSGFRKTCYTLHRFSENHI